MITYSYDVTNSGNVTLNPVYVTDPMSGLSAISCPATSLAPAAPRPAPPPTPPRPPISMPARVANTGTATGTPPTGPVVTSSSTAVVLAEQNPAISIVKTANVDQLLGDRAR